ncbi:MAG: 50S ribosomal protein L18 [Candidatus Nomurabacteria bacterium GW2011_GWB1_35_20]|uniref:50S ribosomal protein L18 n=1 Tax=Candidatus Nomurabacteria bacterium GW2011_GWB1_35_20 TaxID=1618740 RepID=A0A0G0C900_9BACT|nr:MAG: 50S ribosomal protein L18 [Candidatus Nomurabacteria bacterium GW2011_GWB1_35_20]
MKKKDEKRIRLKAKIRAKILGTKMRPRLSVFRSNKFIYAQIIDDQKGKTLVQGRMIAEACKKIKVDEVVFDRNGFKYTGRIKLVADEARVAGLKF